jgi:hypothetical protein
MELLRVDAYIEFDQYGPSIHDEEEIDTRNCNITAVTKRLLQPSKCGSSSKDTDLYEPHSSLTGG